MDKLPDLLERKLARLGTNLIDQRRGRILIEPSEDREGFWFGGGNTVRDPRDDSLLLIGRYRDAGDSRSGLAAGTRGRELAIFRSADRGKNFTKIHSWNSLTTRPLRFAGGSALRINKRRVEVLVSTEKVRTYPRQVTPFQKPGTGVWGIDRFFASHIDRLMPQETINPLISSSDPAYLHLKDPHLSPGLRPGQTLLLYCAHPYNWTSSTSGSAAFSAQSCISNGHDFFPRGSTWDVAACRITCRLPIPRIGAFATLPSLSLYFYDGAECLRQLDAHPKAVDRPRGYSCEELGGLAYGFNRHFPHLYRISRLEPLFVSPEGTGCSRYASVFTEKDGGLFAIWQRSMATRSQPLFGHRLSARRVERLLT